MSKGDLMQEIEGITKGAKAAAQELTEGLITEESFFDALGSLGIDRGALLRLVERFVGLSDDFHDEYSEGADPLLHHASKGLGGAARIGDDGGLWIDVRLHGDAKAAKALREVSQGGGVRMARVLAVLIALREAVHVLGDAGNLLGAPSAEISRVAEDLEAALEHVFPTKISGEALINTMLRLVVMTTEDIAAHMGGLLPPQANLQEEVLSSFGVRKEGVHTFRARWLERVLRPQAPVRSLRDARAYEEVSQVTVCARHAISAGRSSALRAPTEDDAPLVTSLLEGAGMQEVSEILLPRYIADSSNGAQGRLAFYDRTEGHEGVLQAAILGGGLSGIAGALAPMFITLAEEAAASGGLGWVYTTAGDVREVLGLGSRGKTLIRQVDGACTALDSLAMLIQSPDGYVVNGGVLEVMTARHVDDAAADMRIGFRARGILSMMLSSGNHWARQQARRGVLFDNRGWLQLSPHTRDDAARRLYLWLASEWNRRRQTFEKNAPYVDLTPEEAGRRAGVTGAGGDGQRVNRNALRRSGASAIAKLKEAGLVQVEQQGAAFRLRVPILLNEYYALRRDKGRRANDLNPPLLK